MSKSIAKFTLGAVITGSLILILSKTDLDIVTIRIISIVAAVITTNQIIKND